MSLLTASPVQNKKCTKFDIICQHGKLLKLMLVYHPGGGYADSVLPCMGEAGGKVRLEPGLIFEGISHLLVSASSSQLAACRDAAEPGPWCSNF